jgi:hypothetical protein
MTKRGMTLKLEGDKPKKDFGRCRSHLEAEREKEVKKNSLILLCVCCNSNTLLGDPVL